MIGLIEVFRPDALQHVGAMFRVIDRSPSRACSDWIGARVSSIAGRPIVTQSLRGLTLMAARFLCQFGDTAVKDSPLRRVPEKPAMVALFEFGGEAGAQSCPPHEVEEARPEPTRDRLASLSFQQLGRGDPKGRGGFVHKARVMLAMASA